MPQPLGPHCADQEERARCFLEYALVETPVLVQSRIGVDCVRTFANDVLPVVNRFFGPTVTVSGLLTGQDVVAAFEGSALDGPVFLPRLMFDAQGERTLDDWTPAEMEEAIGLPVVTAESLRDVMV